jgi:hypothetical protein
MGSSYTTITMVLPFILETEKKLKETIRLEVSDELKNAMKAGKC